MTTSKPVPETTTDAGIPAESDEHSLTVGPGGPILLQDSYLIEQMAQSNRERIPERQPHAKGSGAFGPSRSPRTSPRTPRPPCSSPVPTGWGPVLHGRRRARQPRPVAGPARFALKFYTSEGNYDMVGNNTPVFFIQDPMKFQHFIRSQKRRADNDLRDHDMQWDFWTLSPESAHQVTWLMGDRGVPRTWRHMNGYSSHTYMWINAERRAVLGEVPLQDRPGRRVLHPGRGRPLMPGRHRLPHAGPLRGDRSRRPSQLDPVRPGHALRRRAGLPVQPVRPDQGLAARGLPAGRGGQADAGPQPGRQPHRDRAVRPVRRTTWCRAWPSRTGCCSARLFSYADSHRYRLGVNYQQIPVNAPSRARAHLQQGRRDARGTRTDPVYAPNSKGGPKADSERFRPPSWTTDGEIMRTASRRTGGRRLGPGGHAGPLGHRRRRPGPAGRRHRRPPPRRRHRTGAAARVRVLPPRRQDLGDRVEQGVRARKA